MVDKLRNAVQILLLCAGAIWGSARGQASGLQLALLHELRYTPWELVMAAAWSPDGASLAVAAGDNIHLYRADNWKEITTLYVGALTHGLAFSPQGGWLAAGSRDGNLRLWKTADLLSGQPAEPVFTVLAHKKGVNSVTFSPDGIRLASGGNDAVARLWDPDRGVMTGMTIGGSFAVPSISFTPDGLTLAVVNGDKVRLRVIGTERISGTFMADSPQYQVNFSPDGKLLVVTGSDNLIRLWQLADAYRTGQERYPEPLLFSGHAGAAGTFRALVWKVIFSPDGRKLFSVGGDGTLRIWETATGTLLNTYFAHPGGATCLSLRADGLRLASGGLDGSLKIWEVKP
jgi:WD40 repeat protein